MTFHRDHGGREDDVDIALLQECAPFFLATVADRIRAAPAHGYTAGGPQRRNHSGPVLRPPHSSGMRTPEANRFSSPPTPGSRRRSSQQTFCPLQPGQAAGISFSRFGRKIHRHAAFIENAALQNRAACVWDIIRNRRTTALFSDEHSVSQSTSDQGGQQQ